MTQNKITLFFSFFILALTTPVLAQDNGTWEYIHTGSSCSAEGTSGSCMQGRHEACYVEVGDRFYLLGGRENDSNVNVYNPNNDSWTIGADAPFSIHHFQAVEYQGLIFIVGGMTGNYPNETPIDRIIIYNPLTDEWLDGPSIPASRRRGSSGVVVANEKIYLISGLTNGHKSGWLPYMDEYDPKTGVWRVLPNAPHSRDHFHAALAGNKIYVGGGRRSGEDGTFNSTEGAVDIFDLNSETWTTNANDIPTHRAAPSVAVIGDEVIYIGGEKNSGSANDETEALNINTGTWRTLTSINTGRHGTQAIVNNDNIWVASGSPNRGGGNVQSQERFYFGSPALPTLGSLDKSKLEGPITHNVNNTSNTITIENKDGNQAILVQNIDVTGSNSFSFSSSKQTPFILKVGEVFDISVSHSGTDNETAQLNITHTGENESSSFELSSEDNDVPLTCIMSGELKYDVYNNISGTLISDLTSSESYPLTPAVTTTITSLFEGSLNSAANYGSRMSGIFCAPQTGNYTFWISGDDNCELWLSTDNTSDNISMIANVPGWTSRRQWTKFPEQKSVSIFLEADQSYYMMALHKEGSGGDNLAVGWELPNGTLERPISASYFDYPSDDIDPTALTNIAPLGTATQSTTSWGGIPSRAIDENTDGRYSKNSVTHTANQSNAWWQVQWNENYKIDEIKIYNRTDNCCINRLSNFTVSILDASGATTFSETFTTAPSPSLTIDTDGAIGVTVKVQSNGTNPLSLAEVEVFGTLTLNIAPLGTASQSSTSHGGVPSRAIDEDTNGIYFQYSVTHTTTQSNAWWQVMWNEDYMIDQINIYNRTDCCPERLANFSVSVIDDSGDVTFSETFANMASTSLTIDTDGAIGRTVKVQLNGTNPLSLAEVEVMGYSLNSIQGSNDVMAETRSNEEEISKNGYENSIDKNAVQIYPNPSSGRLTIDLSNYIGEDVRLVISDLSGRKQILRSLEKDHTSLVELDLSSLTNGIYFLYVKAINGNGVVKKISIAK